MFIPILGIITHAHPTRTRGILGIQPNFTFVKGRTVQMQRDGGSGGAWIFNFVVAHVVVDVGYCLVVCDRN